MINFKDISKGFNKNNSLSYFIDQSFGNFENFIFNKNEKLFVISRYITFKNSLIFLRFKKKVKFVYFFDDDLFDFNVLTALPLKYALKIFFSAYIFKGLLRRLFDEFWVSTPYLQKKYAHLNPKLMLPHQVADSSKSTNKIIVCYHGSASHIKEIQWLLPIISEIHSRTDHVHFEIFGTASVNKLFKNIPRVSVLHPMSWENYLAYTFSHQADIGLAPLLDTKFNLARSPVKFFDYARMGAIGVYTNNHVYKELIVNNQNGILLDNDPQVWVEKIIELSKDSKQLKHLKLEVKKSAV